MPAMTLFQMTALEGLAKGQPLYRWPDGYWYNAPAGGKAKGGSQNFIVTDLLEHGWAETKTIGEFVRLVITAKGRAAIPGLRKLYNDEEDSKAMNWIPYANY